MALENKSFTYVEGYASMELVEGLPFAHAWVVSRDGVVIDNTWRTPGTAYLGVAFSTSYLRKTLMTLESYGILDYSNTEILEEGFPEGAIEKIAGLPSVQRPATMAMPK